MSHPMPQLKPSELADLVNYTLQLPVRSLSKTILEPAIDGFIPATWGIKARGRIERWLDEELGKAGILAAARPKGFPGRHLTPPSELRRHLPRTAEYRRFAA